MVFGKVWVRDGVSVRVNVMVRGSFSILHCKMNTIICPALNL